jgi:hypothetical protein
VAGWVNIKPEVGQTGWAGHSRQRWDGSAFDASSDDVTIVLPIVNIGQTRSFMAVLLRIAAAAIFVVHLTVGCCAHHGHACDGQGQSSPTQGPAAPDSQCPDGSRGHADHSHHGPQDCQGNPCSVVLSSPTVSDRIGQPSQAFVAPSVCDLSSLLGISFEQRFFPTGRLSLPVRLHLANQVLLI